MNKMKDIKINKLTLNVGVGEPGEKLEKAYTILNRLTGEKPVKTKARKRLPEFKLRKGLEIGVKVDLRNSKQTEELLGRLLEATEKKLKLSCFGEGVVSFGIKEYIYIPGIKYDPKLGIFGMNVCVVLERPGYSVKRRTYKPSKVGRSHVITKDETVEYIKNKFGVVIE